MARDHTKLKVFQLADELAFEAYRSTRSFPSEERFGLQSQIRRAAVSVAANIVEGCAKYSTKDYLRYIDISLGSASEARYLLGLAQRLGVVSKTDHDSLEPKYNQLVRSLHNLIKSLRE